MKWNVLLSDFPNRVLSEFCSHCHIEAEEQADTFCPLSFPQNHIFIEKLFYKFLILDKHFLSRILKIVTFFNLYIYSEDLLFC